MFNNVILDVAIGIVFIFLLYSLLATSIQEAIATILALRARTLKDGIVNGMLCNTPNVSKLRSMLNGLIDMIKQVGFFFHHPAVPDNDKKLGHLFYDHPLIKNYGANAVFPTPSYIPGNNFSTVLIDVLKDDFNAKFDQITQAKLARQAGTSTLDQITDNLKKSPDITKIAELLNFYKELYDTNSPLVIAKPIEKETLTILLLHLNNSAFQLEAFEQKLEGWFDDTMNRVSGWYKRRTQFILFAIGITLAILMNVDIIQISGKLSTDKEARNDLVQMAIKQADEYKDDPRIKGEGANNITADSIKHIRDVYQKHIDEAKKTIDSGIVKANQLLALGWGDYGMQQDSDRILALYFKDHKQTVPTGDKKMADQLLKNATGEADYKSASADSLLGLLAYGADSVKNHIAQNLPATGKKNRLIIENIAVKAVLDNFKKDYAKAVKADSTPVKKDTSAKKEDTKPASKAIAASFVRFTANYTSVKNQLLLENEYGFWNKVNYVFRHLTATKLLGFLLAAFAISLGAPFWFDLLNKLVKLRGSGKKEDGDDDNSNSDTKKGKTPASAPTVNVSMNTPSTTGEEAAVG